MTIGQLIDYMRQADDLEKKIAELINNPPFQNKSEKMTPEQMAALQNWNARISGLQVNLDKIKGKKI